MDEHLGVPLNSLIELLVCDLSLIDANLVADDERWLSLTRDDEISEVSVVLFYVALASGE